MSRNPYVRPVSKTTWYMRNGRYRKYMLREVTCLLVGFYSFLAIFALAILAGGAVANTLRVIQGLNVYRERMRANVDLLDGLSLSEAVMLELGSYVGRQVAHDVIYEASMAAYEQELASTPLAVEVEGTEAIVEQATARSRWAGLRSRRCTV